MIPIGGRTRVLAVLGDPVAHSLSPAMHNAAIATMGLDAVYVAIHATAMALPHVLRGFEAAGIAGNLTLPHKVAAAGLIVHLTDAAREVGAVNTFWPKEGRLAGDNTDVAGVTDAVGRLDAAGPWLVAGTGGSARAVAAAARQLGVPILVRSRRAGRADDFVRWCVDREIDARADDGTTVGLAVNATPVGLAQTDQFPVEAARLSGCRAVLDLIYAPGMTPWCRWCAGQGMRVADGRHVLVAQGVAAFARFFEGVTPPREVMAAALERALRP